MGLPETVVDFSFNFETMKKQLCWPVIIHIFDII